MRLINADELNFCNIVKAVISPMGCAMLKRINNDDIPTAYDVDKVIQQLSENREDLIMSIRQNTGDCSQDAISEFTQLIDDYTAEQIEIVKNGGIL